MNVYDFFMDSPVDGHLGYFIFVPLHFKHYSFSAESESWRITYVNF